MAINFPDTPNDGDSYTAGGRTWVYDSSVPAWQAQSVLGSFTLAQLNTAVSDANVAPITEPNFINSISVGTESSNPGSIILASTEPEGTVQIINTNTTSSADLLIPEFGASATLATREWVESEAEATVADDSITLAKLAPGTAGNLISFDAAGAPVAVATGTATHVLTSNGAGLPPTFQAATGGGTTSPIPLLAAIWS